MSKSIMVSIGLLTLLAGVALPGRAQTQTPAANLLPVRVVAWARNLGCEVQYIYVVKNSGASPIRRLLIGMVHPDEGDGAAELSVKPVLNGSSLWIAPWYVKSPSGWNVKARFPEEGGKFSLEWIESAYHAELWPAAAAIPLAESSARTGKPVLPGETVQDFSVMIKQPDAAYLQGRANMDYGDISLNVQIEKGDTEPPTLDLQASQWPQRYGDQWAVFDLKTSVRDNFDGAPRLAPPTVVANQKFPPEDIWLGQTANGWRIYFKNIAGRAYQAQFVATDASGNSTRRTVDYVSVVRR